MEHVWADGDHDMVKRRAGERKGGLGNGSIHKHRATDRKYAVLHSGWEAGAGCGGGERRAVHRGCWCSAGLSEPGGVDGGAIYPRPIRRGGGGTKLSDG